MSAMKNVENYVSRRKRIQSYKVYKFLISINSQIDLILSVYESGCMSVDIS